MPGSGGENRSSWERKKLPGPPAHRGHRTPLFRENRTDEHRRPATHFLLPGFSLFSPPLELLKGDFPFQVVDKFRAETRHVCGGRSGGSGPESGAADRESGNTRARAGASEPGVRPAKLPGLRRGRALGFRRRSRPRAASCRQRRRARGMRASEASFPWAAG